MISTDRGRFAASRSVKTPALRPQPQSPTPFTTLSESRSRTCRLPPKKYITPSGGQSDSDMTSLKLLIALWLLLVVAGGARAAAAQALRKVNATIPALAESSVT